MVGRKKNFVEFIYCDCGCGFTLPKRDNHSRLRKFIFGHTNRNREFLQLRGENHWNYKGGYIQDGYIVIYKPDHFSNKYKENYVFEHRYVYEVYYMCCLLPWIDLHHINEDKIDNRIENLMPVTRSEHMTIHNNLKK